MKNYTHSEIVALFKKAQATLESLSDEELKNMNESWVERLSGEIGKWRTVTEDTSHYPI